MFKLYNEASKLPSEYLDGEEIEFQLATAHVNQQNASEFPIQNFKNLNPKKITFYLYD